MGELNQSLNVSYLFRFGFVLIVTITGFIASLTTIRSTRGPLEKKFMVRCNAGAWALLVLLIVLVLTLKEPWSYLVFIPYGLHLPFAVFWTTQRQQVIRRYEHLVQHAENNNYEVEEEDEYEA